MDAEVLGQGRHSGEAHRSHPSVAPLVRALTVIQEVGIRKERDLRFHSDVYLIV